MAADKQDLEIFLDRKYWKDVIYAALDENNQLIAWASFYFEGEVLWLSLGLKPELTGAGLGEKYVLDCIQFAKSHFKLDNQVLKLDVAYFNKRAIKVYERAGFRKTGRNIKNTQIGKVRFLQMTMIIED
jgi:ribosomal-protein-alanine N-acetyltransferase